MPDILGSGRIRLTGLIALLLASSAQASLGDIENTVNSDATALGAMPVRQLSGTLVHWQIRTATSTVTEHVGPTGQVYAISFSGVATPNLDVLLGSYAPAFNANVRHDRRSASVTLPSLQARLHGHPGAVGGVIWLPALVPPGVNTGALQ